MRYNQTHPDFKDKPLQKFTPRHEQVVMLHCMGLSNEDIARKVSIHDRTVAYILADPRSQLAIEKIRERLLGGAALTVREKLRMGADQAGENILETVNAKVKVGSRAKRHQDQVSFKMLESLGYIGKDEDDDARVVRLSPEMQERLVKAIESSNRAQEIPLEGDFEDVDAQPALTGDSSGGDGQ